MQYDGRMAKQKKTEDFEIACPCCGALIKVDARTHTVVGHTPAAIPKTFADMEQAARAMREQEERKESLFRQSVEAQKHSADLLEKKFQEALKKAKEAPEVPRIRDFDLD